MNIGKILGYFGRVYVLVFCSNTTQWNAVKYSFGGKILTIVQIDSNLLEISDDRYGGTILSALYLHWNIF